MIAGSFFSRYIVSTDHKTVGKQYLWAGLVFLALGGFLAMLLRWQLAFPGARVPLVGGLLFPESGGALSPDVYAKVFTTHGLVMIFFAITPVLIGAFGNFVVPLQIGARDMAFPRLNAASFWILVASQLLALASFLAPLGTASAGWTSYPPLSTNVGTPGWGQSVMVLALLVNGFSTVLGGVNLITTVIRLRAPGMGWLRLPATTWGMFLTSILNVTFVPVLGSAALLLLLDRHLGTQFFIAGASARAGGGDPIAYQHLFWIFGHPEVYILILPAWGVVTDIVSFFSRKPAFAYPLTVGAMIAVTALSGLVYGHHMFVAGLGPMLGQAFMALTLVISIPSAVIALNWLQTIWRGSVRLDSPMLYALGVIIVFGMGGLTGVLLGDLSLDVYLHDTMFVVGHFHLIMASATFLASFAAIHFWFPKLFARRLDENLARAHFSSSLVLLILVFGGQMLAGYSGQPRRLFDPYQYEFLKPLLPLNRWTSYAAFALATAQLLFVWNVVRAFWRGARETDPNPWRVGTLEWTCAPTPVPVENFAEVPQVQRGPHAFDAALQASLGRDFLGQAELVSEAKPQSVGVK
ncbi:MAG: cbb3-type cytochrome c oxidase subunit I [Deltaproteobacteria bacterium]|nr:cbb3-type cytochrome c oxidase subunit I [Deltaproteobacteria bacterium]